MNDTGVITSNGVMAEAEAEAEAETEAGRPAAFDRSEQFPFEAEIWEGQTLAVILREFRRAYGLNLHQVSDAIKVRSVYLDYLETGRHESLPGFVYGVGFVKAYAAYLGLPVDDMTARFKSEAAAKPGPASAAPLINNPFAATARSQTPGIVAGALLTALILIYILWFLFSRISFGGDEGPSWRDRIGAFIFGRSDAETLTGPGSGTAEGDVLSAERPIVIGTDGSVTLAAAPRENVEPINRRAPQNTSSADEPVLQEGQRMFTGTKIPVPGSKPDLSSRAIELARIEAPDTTRMQAPPDTDVPLISPNAVNVGNTTAFGTTRGFNLQVANVEPVSPDVEQAVPDAASRNNPQLSPDQPAARPVPTNFEAGVETGIETGAGAGTEEGDAARITVTAINRIWVQVQDRQGKVLKEAMLAPAEVFTVPAGTGHKLLTGSLSALSLQVDGNAVKTPESVNPVTDTIMLNPNTLLP